MDFRGATGLCEPMTSQADLETIALLCTRAGMIMEDTAPEALERLPADLGELDQRLAKLRNAAAERVAILDAAIALRGEF
jgi:hypothetical protein